MFLKNIFVMQIVVIVFMIKPGSGIKCYICDSTKNPGCTKLTSNSSIVAETCTLDNIKKYDTWISKLNDITYFKAKGQEPPPMRCQKIDARTGDGELVTARLCQLDTANTDACDIFKSKAKESKENGEEVTVEHCTTCTEDYCNTGTSLEYMTITKMFLTILSGILLKEVS